MFESRPLGDGASLSPQVGHDRLLRPARRRVLPRLLAPVHGEVGQRQAVVHRLDTATRRPVRLEDAVALADVAHEVHHAVPSPDEQRVVGLVRAEYQGTSQSMKAR